MKAIISGQAGVALIPDRPMMLLRIGKPDQPLRDIQEAVRCFDGNSDTRRYQLADLDAVRARLERDAAFSDALKIFLFLLDPTEPEEELIEYAECVDELIEIDEILIMLERRMYSAPLPSLLEMTRISRATVGTPRVMKLISDILSHQSSIKMVHRAFDELSPALFESGVEKDRARQHLIDWGAFLELSQALEADVDISFLKLRLSAKFGYWKEAIALWTAKVRPGTHGKLSKKSARPAMAESNDDHHDFIEPSLPNFAAFQQVRAQQAAIVQRLKNRDIDEARKFTAQLIESQRVNSTAEQIAKSLSYLATQAKRQEVPELQLEWADWAERENPEDPLTSGHLADAYIMVGRYGDAEKALDRTGSYGNVVYASTGRGRIFRALGQYGEARASFLRTIEQYDGQDGVEYAYAGAAETLRDQGRYMDALQEYEVLTQKWPLEESFWNGYASTLVDLGRFQEALATFGKAGATSPIAKNGKAAVFKQGGKFEDAIGLYEEILQEYPNNHVALTGRAEALRLKGALSAAVCAYQVAVERCPFIPYPLLGLGNTLSELRRFDEAIATLREGLHRFPDTPSLHIGLAKAVRRSGDICEALSLVDMCLRRFPTDTPGQVLRADILYELGQDEAATSTLNTVLADHPYNFAASTKLAAILIDSGDTLGAKRLLPELEPRSSWDWSRYILRAEIMVIEQGAGKASRFFERGVEQCPFHRQRVLLRSAWASAELGRRRWREARRLVDLAPQEVEPVVRLSVYAATHRPGQAKLALAEVMAGSHSSIVVSLADEIAKRHGLIDGKPDHDFDWIIKTQRAAILLEAA